MSQPQQGGMPREVGRALDLFSRTARERVARGPANPIVPRMIQELRGVLDGLAQRAGGLDVEVSESAFIFRSQIVEEPNAKDSLAPILHRDGIRRLHLHAGLELAELDTLLAAVARALTYTGINDDAASFLSHHQLTHVHVEHVEPERPPAEEIEAVLGAMFGGGELPAISARSVSATMATLDASDSGCHPVRNLRLKAAYAAELTAELERESDRDLAMRALDGTLEAASSDLFEADAIRLANGLLARFDVAAGTGDLGSAGRILQALLAISAPQHRTDRWIEAATAEARVRQAIAAYRAKESADDGDGLITFLRACGAKSAPITFAQLGSTSDPAVRRKLSDLLIDLGAAGVDRLKELARSDQELILREAVYMLARSPDPEAKSVIAAMVSERSAEAKLAVAAEHAVLHEAEAVELLVPLLDDANPRVVCATASALASIGGFGAAKALDERAQKLEALNPSLEVKLAILDAYAATNGQNSLRFLLALAQKAEGLLAKSDAEDTAVAAAEAMARVGTQKSIDILKKLCVVRNKRLREAARQVLVRMKGSDA